MNRFFSSLVFLVLCVVADAQTMKVIKNDGTSVSFCCNEIKEVVFDVEEPQNATSFDGTWQGNFFMFYEDDIHTKRWMADYTVLEFVNSPFTNHGKGYQIDYFTSTYGRPGGCPIPERFLYFTWEINDGNIALVYTDNQDLNTVIYDYHISGNKMSGYIGNTNNLFSMTKIEDYDWEIYQKYIDTYSSSKLPYKSSSLSSFSSYDKKDGYSAWTYGTSYVQACGYQRWDEATNKSNKEVESYLISPALNTTCESGKVRISFDQTIRYEDNVSGWRNYHKVYISKDYTGNKEDFSKATWTELAYMPKASCTNDWTLYTSGLIPIPDEFANQNSVYIAFYFYAPSVNSTTWELSNFLIEEGEVGADSSMTEENNYEIKGSGTKEAPFNVAGIIKYTTELGTDIESDKEIYFEGIICNDPNMKMINYGNATFKISDDGTENNTFTIYRTFDVDNKKFTDATKIKKGDKVVICGIVVNYHGSFPETASNKSHLVSINGISESNTSTSSSEGVSIDGTTVTLVNSAVTESNNTITVELNSLGFSNMQEVGTIELGDGTKVIFDKGTNSSAPKFYDTTKGIRLYANNTITFAGDSPIAKIIITCDEYNGNKYVGNETATVTFNGNNAVYTNAIETGSGIQLRIRSITIIYAK